MPDLDNNPAIYRPWARHPRTHRREMLSRPVTWEEAWEILRNHAQGLLAQGVPEAIVNDVGVISIVKERLPSQRQVFQGKRYMMLVAYFSGEPEQ